MADIELVIKIPEGLKKDFELEQWTALSCMVMKDALMNGTILPKGHGRLIDADALKEAEQTYSCDYEQDGFSHVVEIRDIDNAPTIIEAEDKE